MKADGLIFSTEVEIDKAHNYEANDVSVRELINDDRRRVLEISILAGSKLKRHRAAEPITVLCLKGEGRFDAGAELDESTDLSRGSLIALDSQIDHEVTAISDLRILVTRFK